MKTTIKRSHKMPKKPSKQAAQKPSKQRVAKPVKERPLSEPMKAALAGVAAMPVKRETKLSVLITLLERPEGANLEDMIAATGWQKHTIRSALSHALAKKRGYQIVSEKADNAARIYKITGRAQ
jgi:hypothetical protein